MIRLVIEGQTDMLGKQILQADNRASSARWILQHVAKAGFVDKQRESRYCSLDSTNSSSNCPEIAPSAKKIIMRLFRGKTMPSKHLFWSAGQTRRTCK